MQEIQKQVDSVDKIFKLGFNSGLFEEFNQPEM